MTGEVLTIDALAYWFQVAVVGICLGLLTTFWVNAGEPASCGGTVCAVQTPGAHIIYAAPPLTEGFPR